MTKLTDRRSIRKYVENYQIPRNEMIEILTEATRAPSSMNMQPWRFVVVESEAGKERLKSVMQGNQSQLKTSSAMIVIFTDLRKYDYAEKIFDLSVSAGLMPVDVKDRQLRSISNMAPDLSDEQLEKSGLFDCGLVAMQLMQVAKAHGYDTCPIGGFKHSSIAQALGYDEKRYKPALIVSIGKKDEEGYVSTRLDVEDITTFM